MERVMLHCDCDSYYASVEEKYNPSLRNIPFAVCGDPAMRHSIVMAKNILAKRAGVKTGLSYAQAKQICPGLGYVKADMPKYLEETKATREVYYKYSDKVFPYGMDESWVDLTDMGVTLKEAEQIADLIRIEIKYSLGLSASVGVSFNYIFSKMGSDLNKPNRTVVITRDNFKELIWPMPAEALLFVGSARKKTLNNAGITTIGDIANANPKHLHKMLGKVGYDLFCFANGDDRNFDPTIDEIGSVGNTITTPADMHDDNEASAVIYLLVYAIVSRLKKHNLKTKCISICTRDNQFDKIIRQRTLIQLTDNVNAIFNTAFDLFKTNYNWQHPLRSIGVRVDKLDVDNQISLFGDENCELSFDINSRIKALTQRFGKLEFEKTATTKEW